MDSAGGIHADLGGTSERHSFMDQETMNDRSQQPTQLFVRDLLGDPDDPGLVFDDLTPQQRLGLSVVRLADDIHHMRTDGCERLHRLERWYWRVVGAGAGISAVVAVSFVVIRAVVAIK